jgi:Skp family chaperone for outer membrane proteins
LAQNNALLGNISEIRRAQADAQAELDFQRTQMEAQYQQAIREAIAQSDLQKAQALYQEAKRVDESLVNTAVNQANMDWTVWNALYNKR